MKRLIATLVIALGLAFPAVALVPAVSTGAVDIIPVCDDQASNTDACKAVKKGQSSENPVVDIIKTTIEILSYIIGAVVVIILIVSGIRFVTSQGDAQGVAQARSAIVYSLIALVVVVLARVIVGFILSKLG